MHMLLEVAGLKKSFGSIVVADDLDLSMRPVRPSASSGRTVPARPRCSI
jgi:ABC-type branched-subunit amino acid transport system ATPase component